LGGGRASKESERVTKSEVVKREMQFGPAHISQEGKANRRITNSLIVVRENERGTLT